MTENDQKKRKVVRKERKIPYDDLSGIGGHHTPLGAEICKMSPEFGPRNSEFQDDSRRLYVVQESKIPQNFPPLQARP